MPLPWVIGFMPLPLGATGSSEKMSLEKSFEVMS